MSRKITEESLQNFYLRKKFNKSNMSVEITDEGETLLKLHGNTIAGINYYGTWITDAGRPTSTTFERLNGFDNVRVNTKKGQTYLNGEEWDGKKVYIN
jgi:beta-glucosidase/6-phospho-beta-glucosidase/beta-galactosidase